MWEIWRSCITISRARKLVLSGPESSQHLLIVDLHGNLFTMLCKFLFLIDKHILNTILILALKYKAKGSHITAVADKKKGKIILS